MMCSNKSSRVKRTCSAIGILAVLALLSGTAALAAPSVSNVTSNTTTLGTFDKYELTFNVATVATKPYWPYDTAPNTGVPAKAGVSVDGLFSRDNWQTTVVQPGFYYQDFERGNYLMAEKHTDWIYPKGYPCWKIRFAPTTTGTWKYKIRVTDSSGTITYDTPSNTFTCTSSTNRGFVRVSPNDCRYFETSEGSYLNLLGLSDGVSVTYDMDALYSTYAANGINLVRPWWQASQGPILFGISGQGGVPGWRNVDITSDVTRPGQLFSGRITADTQVSTRVDVKPSSTYKYSVWVKTVNLQGSGDYGIYLQAFDCVQADIPLTSKLRGNTDWTQLSATVTTKAGQYVIDFLKLVGTGITSGAAYYTDISVKEDLGNGQYGPELMTRTNFNAHQYVSQYEAWKADYQVECAKRNNVYLKICIEEKADTIFGKIQPDGTAGAFNDNNVYASDTHASRTYQKYFWRYMAARYGYATSIHSWEFCNEGDPFNTAHYNATQALATFMQQNDPNQHLVSTSLWHSYPTKEFWGNPNYQAASYTDWHQYIGLQNGSNLLQYIYGWQRASAGSGDSIYYPFTLDKTIYRSAPHSLYINNPTGADARGETYPFAISPGHKYTLTWYIKGRNLTTSGTKAGSASWVYPSLIVSFRDGWWTNEICNFYSGAEGEALGTFDWTKKTFSVTAPTNAHYMIVLPSAHWAVGELWYDDITLYDETAGEYVELPNGNFDANRLDFDSALMTYSIGTQAGAGSSRVINKPLIRGENGISGDKIYGDVYKGFSFTGENQQLVNDTAGIWYKKFIWGHINPFGVTDMYWWRENITKNGLYKYARAYQNFIAGIPLSNGRYTDAKASCSAPALRAWGQKDLTAHRAHLWIDNVNCTWKNIVDGVGISAVTGTVTVAGFTDGNYKVEWWDTTTGTAVRTENVTCSAGKITLQVQNLQSDTACKISPAALAAGSVETRVIVPSRAAAGEIVTVTAQCTNSTGDDATDFVITATVPVELEYVAGSAEATGGAYDSNSRTVKWPVGTVAAQTTVTRSYKAKIR